VKIQWPLPSVVVDPHDGWMDLEAQLWLRAMREMLSRVIDDQNIPLLLDLEGVRG
jgi:hypothetical protein